ncbi:MAG TPA: SUKH-3 domain-containing protein [Rugosimonospora sp.]|nr:SUKH-3 domain-containing protein [Rugosimonospora sp.]
MTDGVDWRRVPDAGRPERLLPVDPPDEVGGFRFARTDDGAEEDGGPLISPERGYVSDELERERLLGYLRQGASVLETMRAGADRFDPTRQYAVPVGYRTDGVWVWPAAVEYYLRWHRVAPEPEFRKWIAEHGYTVPAVPDDVVARARTATLERSDILQRRIAEYRAAHPGPGADRFTSDIYEALRGLGWQPGRDVRDRVDPWLASWADDLAELPFERDGYPRYEPFPAALAVLYEFGGLYSLANDPGETSAKIPFAIYPGREDDLMQFAVVVQMLGDRIGQRVFQVGDVERGMGALVIDELGRVFAVGPVELYLGKDIGEALTRMLRGVRAEELHEVGL